VSLGRQEESHSSSCRRADLLTVSCDQVHKLALLKQTCLTARCGLLLLRRVMTPTCYSCTKLESAACSSLRHVDIRRRHAACNLKSALNTSMHHDFRQCNSLMRLLCYLCPEADFVQPVPFLRELAPPCTLSERRSRDRETTVNPAGIWSTRLWRNSPVYKQVYILVYEVYTLPQRFLPASWRELYANCILCQDNHACTYRSPHPPCNTSLQRNTRCAPSHTYNL